MSTTSTTSTASPFSVAYILGTGHCGSTLLSMLLNGHSRMFGMSAVRKIDGLLAQPQLDSSSPLASPLWQAIAARYQDLTGEQFSDISIHHPSWKEFRTWSTARCAQWAGPLVALLQCIADETGKDILVDSSKSWQQLYLLRRSGLVDLRVIHALRDGRAVLHSYRRKYDDFSFCFGQWAKPTAMAAALRPMFDADHWRALHYERLADQPEAQLTELCNFLGANFEPDMLRFRSHTWDGILGNRMAKGGSEEIRRDEKWRQGLTRRDRVLFEVLGSPLNRYFGYRIRS